ncbi:MAG: hypothetical protein EOO13_16170 [Chitinophagaceae bacterium]|nr:MAG: hypothetical protein EOO13_16170 [Chitinophagaceae bacterium]
MRGPNHVFDFVNPGYQALFPEKKLKGVSVAGALPEVVEQGFIDILDNVYNSGETFYAKEIPIMLDRGDDKLKQCYFDVTYQQYKEGNQTAGIAVFAGAPFVFSLMPIEHALILALRKTNALEESPSQYKLFNLDGSSELKA